jgi:hypothetical protein
MTFENRRGAGIEMFSTIRVVRSLFVLVAGFSLIHLSTGCRLLIGDLIEIAGDCLHAGFSRGSRALRGCGFMLVSRVVDFVGEGPRRVKSSASACAKRYDSGKMRNMCKSKTLQIKEDAQHAQIVEMRKHYETRKMLNMCKMCIDFRGVELVV